MVSVTNFTTIDWEIGQLVKTNLFPDEQAVLRSALRACFNYSHISGSRWSSVPIPLAKLVWVKQPSC